MNDRVIPNLPPVLKSRFAGLTLLARQTQTDAELLPSATSLRAMLRPGQACFERSREDGHGKKGFFVRRL